MTHGDGEFLTPHEVKDLTGTRNTDEQQVVLTADGIPYRVVRDKRILVSRYHVREWLAGRITTPSRGVDLSLVK